MNKKFKKIAASVMAVMTLAVGMTGMSASAYSNSVHLHSATGAPGSSTCTSKTWNFTTSKSTLTMNVSSFSKTSSNTYIYLYATVNGASNPVISRSVYNRSGSASAYSMKLGRSAYASARIRNISGNISGYASVNG